MLCKQQSHAGTVCRGFANRGVMQVEDEIRSLWHELRRLEQTEILRAKSRIKLAQGLRRLPSRQADAGCLVGLARYCVFHELRSRRTQKNSAMMKNLRVAR